MKGEVVHLLRYCIVELNELRRQRCALRQPTASPSESHGDWVTAERSQNLKNWRALRAGTLQRVRTGLWGKEPGGTLRTRHGSAPSRSGWDSRSGSAPPTVAKQPAPEVAVRGGRRKRVKDGGGRRRGAGGAGAWVLEARAPKCAGLTGAEAGSAAAAAGGRAWAWWARARATLYLT